MEPGIGLACAGLLVLAVIAMGGIAIRNVVVEHRVANESVATS